MSAYGDRMRALMQGYDGSLELIERGERMAEEWRRREALGVAVGRKIVSDGKRLVLGSYSISFHPKPADAERAGGSQTLPPEQTLKGRQI